MSQNIVSFCILIIITKYFIISTTYPHMKQFRFLMSVIVAGFLVQSSVFAQSSILPAETTDIKEIKARYCNNPEKSDVKALFLDAKVDEKEVICIDFINTSNKTANIGINFVDGTVTNDESQNKACLPENEKTNFWQYVSNYPENISIKPNSAQRVFVDLLYTGGFAGTSYGCLTFHSLNNDITTNTGTMFNVFSRVWSFIDVFVEGDFTIQLTSTPIDSELYNNLGDNNSFYIYRVSNNRSDFLKKDFWSYKARWNVTNTWNIAVTGHINLTWNNWFVLQGEHNIPDQIFVPQQTRTFETTLPWYVTWLLWWPSKVRGSVEYQPIYLWSYAETAQQQVFTLEDSTWYFFFPWIVILILLYGIKLITNLSVQPKKLQKEKNQQQQVTDWSSNNNFTTKKLSNTTKSIKKPSTTKNKTNHNTAVQSTTTKTTRKSTQLPSPTSTKASSKKVTIPKPKKPTL